MMPRALAFLALTLAVAPPAQAQQGPPKGPQVIPVVVGEAKTAAVPLKRRTVGTVQAEASVAIKSRIDGEIVTVHFKDGDMVTEGSPLFSLDRRSLEASVAQAEANLARDRVQAANARRELSRYQPLATREVVSRQKVDDLTNALALAEASVRSGEAAVNVTRVQLSYTEIRAPMSGRTGSIALPRGNTVKANDAAPLVTIHKVQPILVAFSLPQRDLSLVREGQAKARLPVEAVIPGDGGAPIRGELGFIDNAVDPATGTIILKASFANPDLRLWPGQLVNVTLILREDGQALVVPETAVQSGQSGSYVYRVKEDNTVEPRPVKVNRNQDGLAVLDGGIAPGDKVVVDGQFRLAPGARIEAKAPAGAKPAEAAKADKPGGGS